MVKSAVKVSPGSWAGNPLLRILKWQLLPLMLVTVNVPRSWPFW